jgi:hypothetical protein
MLAQLQQLWMIEATKYNVLPLDDRMAERANADLAVGRNSCTAIASSCSAAWAG